MQSSLVGYTLEERYIDMPAGLLFDQDELVASFLFKMYGQKPFKIERALGIIANAQLVGAVIFHNWNGANVEMSYYGKNTMTVGIVRLIARFMICTFDPSRLTVVTIRRNKRLIRAYYKLGFKLEGTQRCYYGKKDCQRNTGVRFVMFRDRIDEIAKLPKSPKAVQC